MTTKKKTAKKKVIKRVVEKKKKLPFTEHHVVTAEVIESHNWTAGNDEHSYCRDCTHWRHASNLPMCPKKK